MSAFSAVSPAADVGRWPHAQQIKRRLGVQVSILGQSHFTPESYALIASQPLQLTTPGTDANAIQDGSCRCSATWCVSNSFCCDLQARAASENGASSNGASAEPEYDYDLFTIGAGSGGTRASRLSASVYGAAIGRRSHEPPCLSTSPGRSVPEALLLLNGKARCRFGTIPAFDSRGPRHRICDVQPLPQSRLTPSSH